MLYCITKGHLSYWFICYLHHYKSKKLYLFDMFRSVLWVWISSTQPMLEIWRHRWCHNRFAMIVLNFRLFLNLLPERFVCERSRKKEKRRKMYMYICCWVICGWSRGFFFFLYPFEQIKLSKLAVMFYFSSFKSKLYKKLIFLNRFQFDVLVFHKSLKNFLLLLREKSNFQTFCWNFILHYRHEYNKENSCV